MKLSLTPALGFSTAHSVSTDEPTAVLRSRPKGRKRIVVKAVRPVSAPINDDLKVA